MIMQLSEFSVLFSLLLVNTNLIIGVSVQDDVAVLFSLLYGTSFSVDLVEFCECRSAVQALNP